MSTKLIRQYLFLVAGGIITGFLIASIPWRFFITVVLLFSYLHIATLTTLAGLGGWPEDELKVVWWNAWVVVSVLIIINTK